MSDVWEKLESKKHRRSSPLKSTVKLTPVTTTRLSVSRRTTLKPTFKTSKPLSEKRSSPENSSKIRKESTITPKISEKDSFESEFSNFIKNPKKFLFGLVDVDTNQIKEFQKIYESHRKGNSNEQLNLLLMKQIEDGKFNELFSDSFFRMNSKEEFISSITKSKEENSWTKEVKKLFRKTVEEIEEEENHLTEKEVNSLVIDKLFEDWVNEKSELMDQLNSLVKFNTSNKNLKNSMMKKVKETIDLEMLFPEIEEIFKSFSSFQLLEYNSEFELFSQMNEIIQEKDIEIQDLKLENGEMKIEIERLHSVIHQIENMNPDIPKDVVFILNE
jgi:hypothetical protein